MIFQKDLRRYATEQEPLLSATYLVLSVSPVLNHECVSIGLRGEMAVVESPLVRTENNNNAGGEVNKEKEE